MSQITQAKQSSQIDLAAPIIEKINLKLKQRRSMRSELLNLTEIQKNLHPKL